MTILSRCLPLREALQFTLTKQYKQRHFFWKWRRHNYDVRTFFSSLKPGWISQCTPLDDIYIQFDGMKNTGITTSISNPKSLPPRYSAWHCLAYHIDISSSIFLVCIALRHAAENESIGTRFYWHLLICISRGPIVLFLFLYTCSCRSGTVTSMLRWCRNVQLSWLDTP